MLDIPKIRKSFEFLSGCTYLNTASVGLSWVGLGAAVAEFYEVAKANGITARDRWSARQEDTKVRLGSLVKVPDSRIHFVGSTTEALNLVALGMPLRPGDRVVVAADEFPSVIQPWLTRAAHGIELVRVPIPCESERSQALAAALTGNVRALAVSHVHWQTGTRVNLPLLSAATRRGDCRLIVDGVQAVAATPVDAGLADAYCASTFKWLLSGFGLGFLTMSERFASEWTPPLRGYANLAPSRNPQYGHVNYPGIYALNASLQYFESLGWDSIHRHVSALSERLHNTLSSRGFETLTPADARAGIVSIRRENAQAIVRALAAEAIFVEDRDEIVRVSPHLYNTDDDIDRFVSSLVQHA